MEALHDDHIHPHIEKTLFYRLYLFLGIAFLLLVYVVREIWVGDIFWITAVLGVALGVGIGAILGSYMGVAWHEAKSKVISKLDIAGAVALGLFITIDISREWIFGHWIHGVTLSVFTLCFLAGALFGRFLGMKTSVMRILKEKNIAKGDPDHIL